MFGSLRRRSVDGPRHVDFIVQLPIEQHESALDTECSKSRRFVESDGLGIGRVDPQIDPAHTGH